MKESKRPRPLNVEETFNQFVVEFGGQLVSSLIPKTINKPNADYVFYNPEVIAELKCFQKDLFNNEEDVKRLFKFFEKWKTNGFISKGDELKLIFGTKKLPKECYIDLLNASSKTIERAIHYANKQIRETKSILKKPNAKGLLLLANDGNYFLQHDSLLSLISDLMQRKYIDSAIDGFVYFTINQVAYRPNSNLDWHLWVPAYRYENDKILSGFVNKMGNSFFNDFYTKITGILPTNKKVTDKIEEGIKIIHEMRYIPKNIAYKKQNNI